jgi:threonine/homoserine/homoserine lactone efflux protein
MGITMSSGSITALFGAMIVLASVPDAIALSVVGRSIASGFKQGLFTVIGIVVGDYIFIIVAVYGLSIIAQQMDMFFIVIKYMAGAYLLWLGVQLWKSKIEEIEVE